MRRPFLLGAIALVFVCLALPTEAVAQLRIAAIGSSQNNRAADDIPTDLPGATITRIFSTAVFNGLTPADLRADFDVLIITWDSDPGLNLDWNMRIVPYLELGGGVIFEDPNNVGDLLAGVIAIQVPDGGSSTVSATVPGLTDGIVDSFVNNHIRFTDWDPALSPFLYLTSDGPSFTTGLFGEISTETGCGRIVLTGPDQDFHGFRGAGDPAGNQYNLLLNEVTWVAEGCESTPTLFETFDPANLTQVFEFDTHTVGILAEQLNVPECDVTVSTIPVPFSELQAQNRLALFPAVIDCVRQDEAPFVANCPVIRVAQDPPGCFDLLTEIFYQYKTLGNPNIIAGFLRGVSGGLFEEDISVLYDPSDPEFRGRTRNFGSDFLGVEYKEAPDRLQAVIDKLNQMIAENPGSADKLEDAVAKAETAKFELFKPDRQAAAGNLEGAVGDIEAAVKDGLVNLDQGIACMDELAGINRQLAREAIDEALAVSGDPVKINEAQESLLAGDELRAFPLLRFKDAAAEYKNALAIAEGA